MSWGARGQRTRAYARPPKARKKKWPGATRSARGQVFAENSTGCMGDLYMALRECKERNGVTSQLTCAHKSQLTCAHKLQRRAWKAQKKMLRKRE